jgi:hypothetical protein
MNISDFEQCGVSQRYGGGTIHTILKIARRAAINATCNFSSGWAV